jgi:hypothetical protein
MSVKRRATRPRANLKPRTQQVHGIFDGKGMFTHPAARSSAERALSNITTSDWVLPPAFKPSEALAALTVVADVYWTAHDRAHPTTAAQLTKELAKFRRKAVALRSGWSTLSPAAKSRLTRPHPGERLTDRLEQLISAIDRAVGEFGAMTKESGGRPDESSYATPAAEKLMLLWASFGGAPPAKPVDQAIGSGGRVELVQASHQFVLLALQGIDASIKLSTIEAALTAAVVVKVPR